MFFVLKSDFVSNDNFNFCFDLVYNYIYLITTIGYTTDYRLFLFVLHTVGY